MSAATDPSAVFSAFRTMDDAAWLDTLLASLNARTVHGVPMPEFPPPGLQREIHGHDGSVSLHEAHVFYREIKAWCAYAGRPIGAGTSLLDFDCGWGRMGRLFMKDVAPQDLFGVESTPRFLMAARQTNPALEFLQRALLPPLVFGPETLDTVISWSAFAHLDEFLAGHWVREFHRILKPNGMAVFTTQSRRFINFCAEQRLKRASGMRLDHPWHEACADSFTDESRAMSRFEQGHFLYASTAKPPQVEAHHGEAIIPRAYIQRVWGEMFRLVTYMDNPVRLPQVLIVLQKIG